VGSVRQRRPREKIRATAFGPETPLLVAAAVERMAIFPGVAKVPDARMRGMALAGLDRDQPFAAAGKPLELDRRKRVLRQQAAERQNKNDVSLFHMHTQSFSTPTRSKAQGRLSKRVAGCQFSAHAVADLPRGRRASLRSRPPKDWRGGLDLEPRNGWSRGT
jgi:hypothetical protein